VSRTKAISSTSLRRTLASTMLGLFIAGAVAISPAQADSYRYWSYLLGQDNAWVMAQTGPGDRVLSDRDVDGWQFGIFGVEGGATPDETPDFAALCPELEATGPSQGQVRVAVVIDSGMPQEAPEGEAPFSDRVACMTIASGSNGYQALANAATARIDNGMVCGIDGYPASECAAVVSDTPAEVMATSDPNASDSEITATADEPAGSGFASLWLWIAIALAAAAFVVILRRRQMKKP
jgi:hypothetical protein